MTRYAHADAGAPDHPEPSPQGWAIAEVCTHSKPTLQGWMSMTTEIFPLRAALHRAPLTAVRGDDIEISFDHHAELKVSDLLLHAPP